MTRTLEFTIRGNQEDRHGNPIPYERVLKQHMRARSVRYMDWQAYVRTACIDVEKNRAGMFLHKMGPHVRLEKGEKCHMAIFIEWASGAHGDGDNVWKGIADALFVNDKDIDGSFVGRMSESKQGKVDVIIKIGS